MGGLWEPLWQPVSGGGATSGLTDDLPGLTLGASLVDATYLAGARGICAADSTAYVAVWNDGSGQAQVGAGQGRFAVVDCSGAAPVRLASVQHDLLRGPRGVDVAGEVVAVISSLSGGTLTLWDITRKEAPVLLGSSTNAVLAGGHRVKFVGRYLYTTGTDAFAIWDVSNPATPRLVGFLDVTGDDIYGMAIKGDLAFLAASASNEYHAVDISNRASPTLISSVPLPGSGPHWMTVDGRYGYTANSGTDSIDIIDVSDPAAMTLVGTVTDTRLNGAHTLAKLGQYLLVCAQSYSGFAVVDTLNPAAPTVAGSVTDNTVMDGVRSMFVIGTRCYWAAPGPQATPFTTGSVGWIDLNGLDVATLDVGSMRADEGEVRGALQVGSLKAHDGATVGPGGIMSLGPIAAKGREVSTLPLWVRKAAQESVTASAALQDDDHLTLTLAAGTTYEFEAVVIYEGATTGDIRVAFTVPAGATIVYTAPGAQTGTTSVTSGAANWSVAEATATVLAFGAAGAGSKMALALRGHVVMGATAGPLRLQWAQSVSDATATIVHAGSTLRATKVA